MKTNYNEIEFQRVSRKAASIGCYLEYIKCGYKGYQYHVYTAENLWCSVCLVQHFETLEEAEKFIDGEIEEALAEINATASGYGLEVYPIFAPRFGESFSLVIKKEYRRDVYDLLAINKEETMNGMREYLRMNIIPTVNAF